jgi:predicted MFS family arabinose efflux permease
VLAAVVGNLLVVDTAFRWSRSRLVAVLPALTWLVVALAATRRRPEGDLVIVGTGALGYVGLAFLLLGVVAAASGPATPSLIGDVVPASRRGQALGIINSGVLVGAGLGYALPVLAAAVFPSWRWCFWLLGMAGACLAFAFWREREPERTDATGPSDEGGQESGREGGQGEEESRVRQIVRERNVEPSPGAMVGRDPSEMSIWGAAKYTVRVRTDLIVLIARSLGDFFFAALATFMVVFVTGWYGLSQTAADIAILGVGVGALAGVLAGGRISDVLLRRGRLNARIWVGAFGYIVAFAAFFPAFYTRSLWIALPLFFVGAFFLAGSRGPLDAVRVDVLVARLRGRTESVRQAVRSTVEGVAPVVAGALSATLASGTKGLQLAFLAILPVLLLNGLLVLVALRTYGPDVAAAMASSEDALSLRRDRGSSGEDAK